VVREIVLEHIKDIYANKPNGKWIQKEDRDNFQKSVKMLESMAKVFREYCQMELDIMGMGRSEEEQKELMQNYMKSMLSFIIKQFDDIPEAQERLQRLLKISLNPKEKEPEPISDETEKE